MKEDIDFLFELLLTHRLGSLHWKSLSPYPYYHTADCQRSTSLRLRVAVRLARKSGTEAHLANYKNVFRAPWRSDCRLFPAQKLVNKKYSFNWCSSWNNNRSAALYTSLTTLNVGTTVLGLFLNRYIPTGATYFFSISHECFQQSAVTIKLLKCVARTASAFKHPAARTSISRNSWPCR